MSGQYKVENSKCTILLVKNPIRLKICKKRSFQFILRLMKIKLQKVSRFLFLEFDDVTWKTDKRFAVLVGAGYLYLCRILIVHRAVFIFCDCSE